MTKTATRPRPRVEATAMSKAQALEAVELAARVLDARECALNAALLRKAGARLAGEAS